jgi:hypothetical protein
MKEMLNKSDVVRLSAEKFRKFSLDFSVSVSIDGLTISLRMNVQEAIIRDDFLWL